MYDERSVKNSHILVDHDSVIPASPLRGKIIRGRSNAERNSPIPDLAIGIALTVRKLFKLPLRHTEGFVQSLLDPLGLPLEAPGKINAWKERSSHRQGAEKQVTFSLSTARTLPKRGRKQLPASKQNLTLHLYTYRIRV